jgi:hypothetical protein
VREGVLENSTYELEQATAFFISDKVTDTRYYADKGNEK